MPCTSVWSRNSNAAEQSSIQQGQSRGSSLRPGAHGREEQKERGRNRQQVSTQPRGNEREQRTAHKRKSKRSAWGVLDSAQEREALLVDWPPGLPATDRCLRTRWSSTGPARARRTNGGAALRRTERKEHKHRSDPVLDAAAEGGKVLLCIYLPAPVLDAQGPHKQKGAAPNILPNPNQNSEICSQTLHRELQGSEWAITKEYRPISTQSPKNFRSAKNTKKSPKTRFAPKLVFYLYIS